MNAVAFAITGAFAVPCVTCGLDYPDTPAHACPRCKTPCHTVE